MVKKLIMVFRIPRKALTPLSASIYRAEMNTTLPIRGDE
jgi:hypothetical protein